MKSSVKKPVTVVNPQVDVGLRDFFDGLLVDSGKDELAPAIVEFIADHICNREDYGLERR